jgi:hypothetical protein
LAEESIFRIGIWGDFVKANGAFLALFIACQPVLTESAGVPFDFSSFRKKNRSLTFFGKRLYTEVTH